MISLGLSTADQVRFHQTLIISHDIKVTVQVLDLNHKVISDVSANLDDGQVNYARDEAVSRSLTLTLRDPDERLGFDTSSPLDAALGADRMIRVVYSVYVPTLSLTNKWVDVPVFTGPVINVSRDDAILSINCHGKEALALPPTMAWTSKTYAKGTKLTALVRDVLARTTGETRFTFPEWGTTVPRAWTLHPESEIWPFCKMLVSPRRTRDLFYDGRGVVRLRSTPYNPCFTISESHIIGGVPKIEYDMDSLRNTVWVKGATPEGKPQIVVKRALPASDPISPDALARNGVRRFYVEVVDDSTLTTQAAASDRADQTLEALSLETVKADFDTFPIPHLEVGDIFSLSTRDYSRNFRVNQMSLPLKAGQPASMGTWRKVSVNKGKIRTKR